MKMIFNYYAKGNPTPDIEDIIGKYPLLVAYINRVLAVPEIKTWVEKRPESEFWARNRYDAFSTC